MKSGIALVALALASFGSSCSRATLESGISQSEQNPITRNLKFKEGESLIATFGDSNASANVTFSTGNGVSYECATGSVEYVNYHHGLTPGKFKDIEFISISESANPLNTQYIQLKYQINLTSEDNQTFSIMLIADIDEHTKKSMHIDNLTIKFTDGLVVATLANAPFPRNITEVTDQTRNLWLQKINDSIRH